ncbi:MAG: hypothetical protein ACFFG0_22815 [Candidatus Thorarchaeota archaeon]
MTPERTQRILEYRVFRHNLGRFSDYITKMQKNYKEYHILTKETRKHSSIKGAGQYFKAQFKKPKPWNGNYKQLWNQYFVKI